MSFIDRSDAGRQLALAPEKYRGKDIVVLALPRGGVPVAVEVAKHLDAPLGVLLVRKIGLPNRPEVAMGAIVDGSEPITVRNEEIIRLAQVSPTEFDTLRQRELAEIARRRRTYLVERCLQDASGRVAIIVDDGIATGATMLAAVRGLRQRKPDKIIIAVPVAPSDELPRLKAAADDVVCLEIPPVFNAVSLQYENFPQLTDAEVVELLERC